VRHCQSPPQFWVAKKSQIYPGIPQPQHHLTFSFSVASNESCEDVVFRLLRSLLLRYENWWARLQLKLYWRFFRTGLHNAKGGSQMIGTTLNELSNGNMFCILSLNGKGTNLGEEHPIIVANISGVPSIRQHLHIHRASRMKPGALFSSSNVLSLHLNALFQSPHPFVKNLDESKFSKQSRIS
jgi:hypothetical protein